MSAFPAYPIIPPTARFSSTVCFGDEKITFPLTLTFSTEAFAPVSSSLSTNPASIPVWIQHPVAALLTVISASFMFTFFSVPPSTLPKRPVEV